MNRSAAEPFQLKMNMIPLTEFVLNNADVNIIEAKLKENADIDGDFLKLNPGIINLQHINPADALDISALIQLFQSHGIQLIGYKNAASEAIAVQAQKAGLFLLPDGQRHSSGKPLENKKPAPIPNVAVKTYQGTVRSGQQITAQGDLVILGSVSATAEVLAVGSIHIYGTLRGRALAGVAGNRHALIYCQKMQAELLSIAGNYQLSDDLPEDNGKPLLIQLLDDQLNYTQI